MARRAPCVFAVVVVVVVVVVVAVVAVGAAATPTTTEHAFDYWPGKSDARARALRTRWFSSPRALRRAERRALVDDDDDVDNVDRPNHNRHDGDEPTTTSRRRRATVSIVTDKRQEDGVCTCNFPPWDESPFDPAVGASGTLLSLVAAPWLPAHRRVCRLFVALADADDVVRMKACTATLVGEHVVLSAAHCFELPCGYRSYVGAWLHCGYGYSERGARVFPADDSNDAFRLRRERAVHDDALDFSHLGTAWLTHFAIDAAYDAEHTRVCTEGVHPWTAEKQRNDVAIARLAAPYGRTLGTHALGYPFAPGTSIPRAGSMPWPVTRIGYPGPNDALESFVPRARHSMFEHRDYVTYSQPIAGELSVCDPGRTWTWGGESGGPWLTRSDVGDDDDDVEPGASATVAGVLSSGASGCRAVAAITGSRVDEMIDAYAGNTSEWPPPREMCALRFALTPVLERDGFVAHGLAASKSTAADVLFGYEFVDADADADTDDANTTTSSVTKRRSSEGRDRLFDIVRTVRSEPRVLVAAPGDEFFAATTLINVGTRTFDARSSPSTGDRVRTLRFFATTATSVAGAFNVHGNSSADSAHTVYLGARQVDGGRRGLAPLRSSRALTPLRAMWQHGVRKIIAVAIVDGDNDDNSYNSSSSSNNNNNNSDDDDDDDDDDDACSFQGEIAVQLGVVNVTRAPPSADDATTTSLLLRIVDDDVDGGDNATVATTPTVAGTSVKCKYVDLTSGAKVRLPRVKVDPSSGIAVLVDVPVDAARVAAYTCTATADGRVRAKATIDAAALRSSPTTPMHGVAATLRMRSATLKLKSVRMASGACDRVLVELRGSVKYFKQPLVALFVNAERADNATTTLLDGHGAHCVRRAARNGRCVKQLLAQPLVLPPTTAEWSPLLPSLGGYTVCAFSAGDTPGTFRSCRSIECTP